MEETQTTAKIKRTKDKHWSRILITTTTTFVSLSFYQGELCNLDIRHSELRFSSKTSLIELQT